MSEEKNETKLLPYGVLRDRSKGDRFNNNNNMMTTTDT